MVLSNPSHISKGDLDTYNGPWQVLQNLTVQAKSQSEEIEQPLL
jgi:hypothetical protein